MSASRWPLTSLLLCLFSSATSSPVSISTSAPPLLSQMSPPSPLPSILPPPSLSIPPPIPPLTSNSAELPEKNSCPLTMTPPALVVRFGDPVMANCSLQKLGFPVLGWEVSLEKPIPTQGHFLVWSVNRMTEWSITPVCWAMSEQRGQCQIKLPLIVFKPPDNVSISFVSHSGPMLEGHQYTLRCTVTDVAPVENLTVTFHRGQTVLDQIQPNNNTQKTPATESFTLNITARKEDEGADYWCEAKLELGAEGPQPPLVVKSRELTTTVHFGPQIICPAKLQVREGESLNCEVRGNPQPSVTWFKDGQVVAPPSHSSRKHAGHYTVSATGRDGQRNLTVEVEVLMDSGTSNSCNRHFLLAVLLIQIIYWL